MINVRIEYDHTDGSLITAAAPLIVGQDFILKTFVQDNEQSSPHGIQEAYLNLNFDKTIASALNSTITHSSVFNFSPAGDTSVDGSIKDAGGFSSSFTPPTPLLGEFQLFSVTFHTLKAMNFAPTFSLSTNPSTPTALGNAQIVNNSDVNFTGTPGDSPRR